MMITQQIARSIKRLNTLLRTAFSSQGKKHPNPDDHDKVQVTKFNPNAEKDLRGFEHF